jgi:hypothetical protein
MSIISFGDAGLDSPSRLTGLMWVDKGRTQQVTCNPLSHLFMQWMMDIKDRSIFLQGFVCYCLCLWEGKFAFFALQFCKADWDCGQDLSCCMKLSSKIYRHSYGFYPSVTEHWCVVTSRALQHICRWSESRGYRCNSVCSFLHVPQLLVSKIGDQCFECGFCIIPWLCSGYMLVSRSWEAKWVSII